MTECVDTDNPLLKVDYDKSVKTVYLFFCEIMLERSWDAQQTRNVLCDLSDKMSTGEDPLREVVGGGCWE
jgi:hypothetical protein